MSDTEYGLTKRIMYWFQLYLPENFRKPVCSFDESFRVYIYKARALRDRSNKASPWRIVACLWSTHYYMRSK